MVEYIGSEIAVKADCTISENKLKTVVELDLGEEGNVTFTQDLNVKTNTESEYTATSVNTIKAEIPYALTCDLSVNVDVSYKTSDVSVSDVEDYIDLTDIYLGNAEDEALVAEMETYIEDAIPNLVTILEALNEVEIINEYVGDDLGELISGLEDFSFDAVTGEVVELQ